MNKEYMDFKQWKTADHFSWNTIFKNIEQVVDVDEKSIFYPQGIFMDSKVESGYLLIFKANKIYSCFLELKKPTVEIKIINTDIIKEIKVCTEGRYDISLIITTENGELTLSNVNDANLNWKDDYYKKIIEIVKMYS